MRCSSAVLAPVFPPLVDLALQRMIGDEARTGQLRTCCRAGPFVSKPLKDAALFVREAVGCHHRILHHLLREDAVHKDVGHCIAACRSAFGRRGARSGSTLDLLTMSNLWR